MEDTQTHTHTERERACRVTMVSSVARSFVEVVTYAEDNHKDADNECDGRILLDERLSAMI